ncbi:hypothetical protein EI94DRAFT_1819005 [Lactarius quietus]|nr:hypothetical protein EI94DRAFT_1819005 [Lactarius quietus]
MYQRLIGYFPHQPKSEPFDFEEVYKVAHAEFTGGHFSTFTLEDDWDPSFIDEPAKTDPMFQKWFNLGTPDSQLTDGDWRGRDRSRNPAFTDSWHREDTPWREAYLASGPINKIITQLRPLSPSDPTYTSLYARCLHRYPAIAQTLQKPDYGYRSAFTLSAPPSFTPSAPPSFAPQQPWLKRPHVPPPVPSNTSATKASFFRRDLPNRCAFCQNPGHRVRRCPVAKEYFDTGQITIINERIFLPNSQPVPNDGSNCGLQHSIDAWLAKQSSSGNSSAARDSPPHTTFIVQTHGDYQPPVTRAHVEEISELESSVSDSESELEEDGLDIFGVFATERKKKRAKAAKLPELAEARKSKALVTSSTSMLANAVSTPSSDPPSTASASAPTSTSLSAAPTTSTSASTSPPTLIPIPTSTSTFGPPFYRYQATVEDQQLTTELATWLLNGKLALTTPAHVLAASPTIRKELCEKLRPRHVEMSWIEDVSLSVAPLSVMEVATRRAPEYSLPLREVDILINHTVFEAGVLDQGSQIVLIRKDLAQEAGAHINTMNQIDMEGANRPLGALKTLSCRSAMLPSKSTLTL